jgi:hypothetical protein
MLDGTLKLKTTLAEISLNNGYQLNRPLIFRSILLTEKYSKMINGKKYFICFGIRSRNPSTAHVLGGAVNGERPFWRYCKNKFFWLSKHVDNYWRFHDICKSGVNHLSITAIAERAMDQILWLLKKDFLNLFINGWAKKVRCIFYF